MDINITELNIQRIATTAVGASALRNMGAKGLIRSVREFLGNISSKDFTASLKSQIDYNTFLDFKTTELTCITKSWGASRKSLNLFFRDITYNHYARQKYCIVEEMLCFLEVPLDSYTGNGIYNDSGYSVPKWTTVKGLTSENSKLYQNAAFTIAKSKNIKRVELDLVYWLR